MRARIAKRLRAWATKLDGDTYVSRTGVYKTAIEFVDKLEDKIQSHVTRVMVDGESTGVLQGLRGSDRSGCECEYWPGITGSNGRITQHAVGCPQRPDTPAPRPQPGQQRYAKPEPRLPDPFRKP